MVFARYIGVVQVSSYLSVPLSVPLLYSTVQPPVQYSYSTRFLYSSPRPACKHFVPVRPRARRTGHLSPLHARCVMASKQSQSSKDARTAMSGMIEVRLDDRLGKRCFIKCLPEDTIQDLKKLASAQLGTDWRKMRYVSLRTKNMHVHNIYSTLCKSRDSLQKWNIIYKDVRHFVCGLRVITQLTLRRTFVLPLHDLLPCTHWNNSAHLPRGLRS